MRLDTLGTVGDFIVHALAVNFYLFAWLMPVGLIWVYVIYPRLTWPVFLIYFLISFFIYYFIFNPFLEFLSSLFLAPIFFIFLILFSSYYLFFCVALFDIFQKFEEDQKRLNSNLVFEEENRIKNHLCELDFLLFTLVPFFFGIFFIFMLLQFIFFICEIEQFGSLLGS